MTSSKKRIWNEKELTIAYYIAKWDMLGVGVELEDLVNEVIGDTTVNSLNMQVANFRFLLNIPGRQLEHASNVMKELVDKYQNQTMTQMRRLLNVIISESDVKIEKAKTRRNNDTANEKRDVLNEQERIDHLNKMKSWKNDPRLSRLRRIQK